MLEFFNRHDKIVLQFSGGKDSLACLFLLKDHWDKFDILWCNTGDAFPETRELVYSFGLPVLEVMGDQPASIRRHGPPSDVLNVWDSPYGQTVDSDRRFRVQTPFECCNAAIWTPIHKALLEHKITGIIRGQRNSEAKKGVIRSGHVEDGREYWFPLEDWSAERVREFLKCENVPLPKNYEYFDSSLDCMTCTAFLADNRGKAKYLEEFHPAEATKRRNRIRYIALSVETDYGHLLHEAE